MREIVQVGTSDLTPEALQDETRYELISVLGFDEVQSFVGEYYWQRRTPLIYAHIALTLLLAGVWLGVGIADGMNWADGFIMWAAGFAGFLLLLPVHEALHGLVYRRLGATDVRYGINWRQLYAYAIAHRFVANTRQFIWVALTPFVVISSLLLLAAALLPDFRAYLLVILVWHTMGTAGDFSLLNYFSLQGKRTLYTYDDADSKKSYFYGERLAP